VNGPPPVLVVVAETLAAVNFLGKRPWMAWDGTGRNRVMCIRPATHTVTLRVIPGRR
jgi:hypothetical protein